MIIKMQVFFWVRAEDWGSETKPENQSTRALGRLARGPLHHAELNK